MRASQLYLVKVLVSVSIAAGFQLVMEECCSLVDL